jgi:flavin-dependent dehydrogenase
VGPFALTGTPPPSDGNAEAYAPRRRVLDQILVNAAVDAGAELREKFSVEALTSDGTTIKGIRGRGDKGPIVTEHARIVIGADGPRSFVARAAGAPIYLDRGMLTCNYYSYWSGVPLEGVELYSRPGQMVVADKTNNDLTLVTVVWKKADFDRVRSNIEGAYIKAIEHSAPSLADRIRSARRVERFAGTGFLPNFLRKPFGAGWALVGDAGYPKDPLTAQGITNSFSHAELLAEALDEGFSGRREMTKALSDYERKRNQEVMPMFEHTCQLAKLEAPPAEMLSLINALRGNQTETDRFLGTITGTVSIPEFFSPENINRVIDASALKPAA